MLYRSFQAQADEIEHEIIHRGAVLGINWHDEEQVAKLAYDALHHAAHLSAQAARLPHDLPLRAKAELFGLADLMLLTMEEAANADIEIHGGAVWKSFERAMWQIAQVDAEIMMG